ncbi:hypothetical protein [Lentzea sp. E54]|uniref:hypothetical protein n=1 Tax=Lentzea xerophila TaxID=3435883 RepID=UPI003DA3E9FA
METEKLSNSSSADILIVLRQNYIAGELRRALDRVTRAGGNQAKNGENMTVSAAVEAAGIVSMRVGGCGPRHFCGGARPDARPRGARGHDRLRVAAAVTSVIGAFPWEDGCRLLGRDQGMPWVDHAWSRRSTCEFPNKTW